MVKQANATQATTYPGEVKSVKGYYEWEDNWEIYLYTTLGHNVVPLSYSIIYYTVDIHSVRTSISPLNIDIIK